MKKNDFWILLGDYFKTYPKQRNYSNNTVTNWKYTWNMFLDWMIHSKNMQPSEITMNTFEKKLVLEFLDDMIKTRKWTPQTRNERLSMIRSFFEYTVGINSMYYSIYQELTGIKKMKYVDKSGIIDYLSKESLTTLLSIPDASTRLGCRNQFYMSLAYDTAARTCEMLSLRVKDIDVKRKTVTLTGKGRKMRMVPVSEPTLKLFKRYLDLFHSSNDTDALVFYTNHYNDKTPMSADTVARFLNIYAKEARLKCDSFPKNVRPHQVFRASRAMHLLQSDAPLTTVSLILGHSDPITTVKHYAAADTEMKRKLMERASKEMLPELDMNDAAWHDKDIIGKLYFNDLI